MATDDIAGMWIPVGPVTEGPVRCYQAKGPAGRFAQVHRIARTSSEFDRLAPLVQAVQNEPPPDLVEVLDGEAEVVVITNILPAHVSLEGWLREAVGRAEPTSASTAKVPGHGSDPQGEDFSELFRIPDGDARPPVPPPSSPPDADPGQSGQPGKDENFTALFEAPPSPRREGSSEPRTEPSLPTPQKAPPKPKQAAPPVQPAAPPPPPPEPSASAGARRTPSPPSTSGPGSITDMLRTPDEPPRRGGDYRRSEGWSEPKKDLSPLQLSLDDYLRRLGYSPGDRGAHWGAAQRERVGRGDHRPSRAGAMASAGQGQVVDRGSSKMSRGVVVLAATLALVTFLAVVIVVVVWLARP